MKSKFLSLCLSIIMAVGIWVYVITVVSPESQYTFDNVSVQLQSQTLLEERGLVITGISHTSVSLQLFGNRTDLVQINSGNIQVFADVSKIYEPGVHDVTYTVSYPGTIPNTALEIQSRSPGVIQVTVEKKVTKKLDIITEYKGAVSDGYLVDKANIQLGNKTVNISGPQSVLDNVTHAKIVIDLTNHTETISGMYPFELIDKDGNSIVDNAVSSDMNTILVNLKIYQVKQVPVRFDVLYGGGATPQNTSVTPEFDTIEISGHKNLLADINSIYLGTIDLSDYTGNDPLNLEVDLPEGVKGIAYVKVHIKFEGLETQEFLVTKIIDANVPDGMDVVFLDEKIKVTLRGTREELDAIAPEDITAVVDFSNAGVESISMPATIEIDKDAHNNVGAVKDYTVDVRIRRK